MNITCMSHDTKTNSSRVQKRPQRGGPRLLTFRMRLSRCMPDLRVWKTERKVETAPFY